jgi:hypothetical protein
LFKCSPPCCVTTFIGSLLGPVVARIVGPAAQRYGLSLKRICPVFYLEVNP